MNATHNIATVFSPSLWDPGEPIASRRHSKEEAGGQDHSAAKCQSGPGRSLPVDEGVSKVPGVAYDPTGVCRDLEGSLQAAAHTLSIAFQSLQLRGLSWQRTPGSHLHPEQLTGCVPSSGSCSESVCLPLGPRVTLSDHLSPRLPRADGTSLCRLGRTVPWLGDSSVHHEELSLLARAEDQQLREFSSAKDRLGFPFKGCREAPWDRPISWKVWPDSPTQRRKTILTACNYRQKCIHKPCLHILPRGHLDGRGMVNFSRLVWVF